MKKADKERADRLAAITDEVEALLGRSTILEQRVLFTYLTARYLMKVSNSHDDLEAKLNDLFHRVADAIGEVLRITDRMRREKHARED